MNRVYYFIMKHCPTWFQQVLYDHWGSFRWWWGDAPPRKPIL